MTMLLVAGLVLPAEPLLAAPPVQVDDALQDCSTVREETLQDELNTVTQEIFAEQIAALDLESIIARQWVTLEMDRAMDEAVDLAVAARAERDRLVEQVPFRLVARPGA